MRIRILLFLMRIRIQLKQICEKLPYEEISELEKDKFAQKYKNHEASPNLQYRYCKKFVKMPIINNFPAFLSVSYIFLCRSGILDPGGKMNADADPGGKMNADPDPQPCSHL